MLKLKLISVIKVATVLLSIAYVLAINGCQTLKVSNVDLDGEREIENRERFTPAKEEQKNRGKAQLLAQRQQRIALVIGNGSYQEDPLANPVNDATDIAQALRELGFKVTLLNNLNWQEMDESIENFSKQLSQGAVGVFYYAGHGVQVEGENYLIPLEAQLKRERDVRREAVPLGDVLRFMEEAGSQVNIVIIDACRDNPFYRQWRSTRGSASVRGLTQVDLPPEGTIIAFATAPGEFAEDVAGQRNSPFTSNLLEYINTPNLEVADMFRQVRAEVLQETDSQQRPWYRESLIGSFFFKTIDQDSASSINQPTLSIITPSEPETILISKTTGIDYSRLSDLLAARKWKEADRETTERMLQATGREKEELLSTKDIDNLSCEDLRIIDQLWLESSQGRFGFSVQKDIYQNLGGTREYHKEVYENFGDRVGWRKGGKWLYYSELTFNLTASSGHLPFGWRPGTPFKVGVDFSSRVANCNL